MERQLNGFAVHMYNKTSCKINKFYIKDRAELISNDFPENFQAKLRTKKHFIFNLKKNITNQKPQNEQATVLNANDRIMYYVYKKIYNHKKISCLSYKTKQNEQ